MRHRPLHALSIGAAVAALIITGGAAAGQTRARAEPQGFVHVPGIAGTSSSPASKGGGQEWIELITVAHVASTRAAEVPREVVFTKLVDQASPKLLEAFKRGTRFQTVRLDVREPGGKPLVYLKYTLQNAMISKYRVDGRVEHITLTCEKIERTREPAPVAGPGR